MRRLRILDVFCGAGGASRGYSLAGFDVYGVDLNPMPRYPYPFHQGDAIAILAALLGGERVPFYRAGNVEWLTLADFDAIHASPPCHDHSALRHVSGTDGTRDLLPQTLELLKRIGLPWVVENVIGADMPDPITLCGSMFALEVVSEVRGLVKLRRHRLFSSSHPIAAPAHPTHRRGELTIGVYGNGDGGGRGWKGSFADRKAVMGIDWMNRTELAQSIPPAYTEFVGDQLYAMILETRA